MEFSLASRRSLRRFILSIAAYAVLITGATWVARNLAPSPLALVALSLIPAIAIGASLIVTGLYLIEETDEYVRRRQTIAMLIASGLLLTLSTALGFLQQRGALGVVDLLWAFPAWCVIWAVAECWMAVRDYRAAARAA